jgi:hypothetical protein
MAVATPAQKLETLLSAYSPANPSFADVAEAQDTATQALAKGWDAASVMFLTLPTRAVRELFRLVSRRRRPSVRLQQTRGYERFKERKRGRCPARLPPIASTRVASDHGRGPFLKNGVGEPQLGSQGSSNFGTCSERADRSRQADKIGLTGTDKKSSVGDRALPGLACHARSLGGNRATVIFRLPLSKRKQIDA